MGSKNIYLTNFFTFFDGLAMGMWNYAILGPYLFKLCGDNKHAGYAEGIQGTAQALASIPASILADRYRRDIVLRWSGGIGALGIALTIVALLQPYGHNWYENFLMLCVGMAVFGVYMGMWSPPLYAIYADSIPSGQRSGYETWRYVLSIGSLASGPVSNMVLFLILGNEWGIKQMTIIFMIGMALHFISIASLFFFSDDDTLGDESDALLDDSTQEAAEAEIIKARLLSAETIRAKGCFSWLHVTHIPYIVAISDVTFGLASGMTIKFFPIYFADVLQLSPILVNFVFVLDPVVEVLLSLTGQKISLQYGRVEVLVCFKIVGIALLWVMATFDSLWIEHPYWLISIYIIRSALINCVVPLARSILMDYCPPNQRAKWGALESLSAFGWSGSAVLGGILVDSYGFDIAFHATATVQLIAWSPLLLLLPLVAREEHAEARRSLVDGAVEEKGLLMPGLRNEERRYSS
ncbi:hypothetical protein SARC_06316 [Sphaeroforma arctica JP610]|uniref:Major facilitator superfamily (MFS) profile domain-containing protein n=1 Tax=Sphaeroforma arctica JP610 TaxID=667725 RepID=A0A0L0FXR6_9EUKA|nr:hypothetical protein SARC_06316 [Sphaeroforma arctica JP610]KNC81356.1 hypothetical protein SARC_06316 [Sphaeroforma arctica JP610]|eukprot:XP_014155258.1 hypothetical protein SARC_06316 [Sphaeroforma arctica JP610]